MPLCGSSNCGCGVVSSTLSITGSGTPDDPWVIEQAEFTDITTLQNQMAGVLAVLDTLADTYVDETGDTMTGPLLISAAATALSLRRTDFEGPFVEFRSLDAATRYGYVQGLASPACVRITAENSGEVQFYTAGAFAATIDTSGRLLVGKAATGVASNGFEATAGAGCVSTLSTASLINFRSNKTGAANADGQVHFRVDNAGTQIGTITRATSTTTAFNTSSDEDLKGGIMPLDEELAEWVLRIIEPVMFHWLDKPDVQVAGYIAQRVAAMWPGAIECGLVTPGRGDIANRRFDSEGQEITEPDEWSPWQMDNSKLIPILHSGWRSLARKVDELLAAR